LSFDNVRNCVMLISYMFIPLSTLVFKPRFVIFYVQV
jgi:hypothetical protein